MTVPPFDPNQQMPATPPTGPAGPRPPRPDDAWTPPPPLGDAVHAAAWATPADWSQPAAPSGSSGSRRPLAAVVAVALLAVLVGAFVVGQSIGRVGVQSAAAPSSSATAPPPTTAAPAPSPTAPGSSGRGRSATPPTTGSQGSSDLNDVISAIDPGVVDIVSQLPGGVGAGTGMVISADGFVLTNDHVVDGAEQIEVTLTSTGDTYSATVVNTDPSNDVAVVHLDDASGLTTIPIGDSDGVKQGDPIVAIGNAGGQGGTPVAVTGTVTALHQQITAADESGANAQTLTDTIQINANIQPGDSGGPLVDANAKVIGMDSAASTSGGRRATSTHEGFAIPINKALSIAKQLEASAPASGSTTSGSRVFLGVSVSSTGSSSGGATVVAVQAGSPAATAGVPSGAVIVGLDRTAITSADVLTSALQSHQPGDQVTLTWRTSSGSHHAVITLGSR